MCHSCPGRTCGTRAAFCPQDLLSTHHTSHVTFREEDNSIENFTEGDVEEHNNIEKFTEGEEELPFEKSTTA